MGMLRVSRCLKHVYYTSISFARVCVCGKEKETMSRPFRKCITPCQRFRTPDDSHELCAICLGEEHARSALLSGSF